jgi:hypothetical protein
MTSTRGAAEMPEVHRAILSHSIIADGCFFVYESCGRPTCVFQLSSSYARNLPIQCVLLCPEPMRGPASIHLWTHGAELLGVSCCSQVVNIRVDHMTVSSKRLFMTYMHVKGVLTSARLFRRGDGRRQAHCGAVHRCVGCVVLINRELGPVEYNRTLQDISSRSLVLLLELPMLVQTWKSLS